MRNYCTPEDFDATTIDNCFESSCFHSCCGRRGPRGFRGATGPTGATGATGATGTLGQCSCSCTSLGEQVENPGMEAVNNQLPVGSIANSTVLVTSTDAQGRVHSGQYAVNLKDNGRLSQFIDIQEGCFYAFSFFAKGEGQQIGLTASVIFRNDVGGELARDTITIRNQDTTTSTRSWGYYRILTKNAPLSAARAEIVFLADGLGEQSIDIDDVSFHAA